MRKSILAGLALVASVDASASDSEPCCKKCTLPLVKYFSTDAAHGFCGEACMDPAKFDLYHKFEANLTRADHLPYPCSQQRTPDNKHHYIKYTNTVTHGVPGLLAVTLDLYAPNEMPDHSCCVTPLFSSLNCVGIPGKSQSMTIFGTGPYCCPKTAKEASPCGGDVATEIAPLAIPPLAARSPMPAAEPCCQTCKLPLVKFFSTDAPHGFCGEACMDPAKFDLYHKFEANLTRADHLPYPCSQQRTPDNKHHYIKYTNTVTHGVRGLLAVTLDLYAPNEMPDHSCCVTPLFSSLNCVGIPGKSKSMTIFGTGPYCCPKTAKEASPCGGDVATEISPLTIPPLAARSPTLAAEPCCQTCKLPLVKFFSTDAPHGFCGEACMDPTKFDLYHKFEANLTRATSDHPCSKQFTPSNTLKYTEYFNTVTHGVPGLLAVTLDLYAPTDMPDHSCCVTPLFSSLNCFGIPGKPKSLTIAGTGPYCCPSDATETQPCSSAHDGSIAHFEADAVSETKSTAEQPCCKGCTLPLVKFFSTDAPHGFCGEACMDPTKFDLYHKFEANLTKATTPDPCSQQRTPSNKVHYTDYTNTVTHGLPGLLSVTLDLYAPTHMPDHSCCVTPLISSLNCIGIPGKSKSLTIFGTGPYCCPSTATEAAPCASSEAIMV